MAGFGVGSVYIPPLYHRMASISFDEDRLEEAKRFAMILVRSTPELYWVSKGREILNRIIDRMVEEEEASVRKGVIGCLLPLSGPYALYGQELLNGIQLGMGIFDSKEGDQQIELVIRDTRGNEEEAILGVEELAVRENVMAIIGPLASRPATAAASMAQELGVPIVTLTQKDGITEEGDMVFRNFLTPSKEVETLLKEAIEVRGLRSFAIFYPDNPYGRFFMDLFWDKAEEMGGTITAVESYKQDETDFAVQIKKMVGLYYPRPESVNQMLLELKQMEAAREEAENPDSEGEVEEDPDPEEMTEEEEPEPIVDFDAVFIPGSYQNVALIAPQFPFYNIFNIHFLGTSLWRSYELIETTGDYIQGAIFPSGFFSEDTSDGVQAFVKAYRETFESDPGVLAADGYDTIRFVKNLVNRGIINTRKDFQAGLFQEDGFYGVTGEISFDKQGEVKKDPVLLTISGRRLRKFR
ncbi:MAG: penicillin-binding protein activator [Deltaproteobacteria bacterium]|nr:penicillin-binding protein activator [Deltaproteobacteria bacterium]